MEVFNVLALIAFGAGAVIAAVERSWAVGLVGAGLFLLTLPRVI